MNKIEVPVFNNSTNKLPTYATNGSAGVDLKANLNGEGAVVLHPGKRMLIDTGLQVAIPEGYEIQVRPRSGLALKNGITVLNTPGTVDSDYRNRIGVILMNHSNEPFTINEGDRIAQAVLTKVEQIDWTPVSDVADLSKTDRGLGGFGHSGVK